MLINDYSANFKIHGLTPNGVFWNSSYNQFKRFEELINYIKPKNKKLSICDVGCGYGALYAYLTRKKLLSSLDYHGVDINKLMVKSCQKNFPKILFGQSNAPIIEVDFAIMSGTYNYSVIENIFLWEKYILENLTNCWMKCKSGIIFNIQRSDSSFIRNKIFYTTLSRMKYLLSKKFKKISCYKSKYFDQDLLFVILK